MDQKIQKQESKKTLPQLLSMEPVKARLSALLSPEKVAAFCSSLIQIQQGNAALAKCEPQTILNAAVTAAVLNLPINPHLGFAWIVPYKDKAQFQVGAKGFIQLAIRSGAYQKINVVPVYKNQFTSFNSLTEELVADFTVEGDGDVVGYCAYFELMSGFKKTVYWPKQKVQQHAKRFSKGFSRDDSVWRSDFDAMALKTVIKSALSKWGLLSIDQQIAISADQSVQTDPDKYEYPDNEPDFDAYVELESEVKQSATKKDEKPLI